MTQPERTRRGDAPIIELRRVSKRFGQQQVLDAVDLQLSPGGTTVVIGESGAGKSVLLKHIVGLIRPDSGEVYFKGLRIDSLSDRHVTKMRRHFGFLFQSGALFDSMTAGDNVGFPVAQQTKKKKAEVQRIVSEKLGLIGLDGIQSKMPTQLSGGQRKRVALARAIALNPEVVLYDEPTTGLDPVRADGINELILKLQRELRVTSVVVTHDMATVYKVANRVLMLHRGRFIFDGTSEALRASEDDHVRRFVEGRADDEEDRMILQEP